MPATPLVVLVGYREVKLERLKRLYEENKPQEKHDVVVVYNGQNKSYSGADIYIENSVGRDIEMYHEAVEQIDRNFYFFMNADTVHIEGNEWLKFALEKGTEIVGAQYNLASLVSIGLIRKVAGSNFPPKWIKWGRTPMFIRTSAFGCVRDFFLRLYKVAKGNPYNFEKNTMKISDSYSVFDNPFYIHDGNLAPYFKV